MSSRTAGPAPADDDASVRVLVADDDALARRGVREDLEAAGIQVVAEATTGREAIDRAIALRPQVVLMDVLMPELDGIAATRRIAREAPGVRVVVMTLAPDRDLALLALRSGAQGYVPKTLDPRAMPTAVRVVAAGGHAITPQVSRWLLERLRELPEAGAGLRPVFSTLSRREWEVVDRLSAGRTADQIAAEFVLSPETVRSHIKSVLRKLGVHSQAEAVAAAARLRGAAVPAAATAVAAGDRR